MKPSRHKGWDYVTRTGLRQEHLPFHDNGIMDINAEVFCQTHQELKKWRLLHYRTSPVECEQLLLDIIPGTKIAPLTFTTQGKFYKSLNWMDLCISQPNYATRTAQGYEMDCMWGVCHLFFNPTRFRPGSSKVPFRSLYEKIYIFLNSQDVKIIKVSFYWQLFFVRWYFLPPEMCFCVNCVPTFTNL